MPLFQSDARAAASDAFGRQRVSAPTAIFDAKSLIDGQALLFDDVEASGADTSSTHSAAKASVTLGVAETTAGSRIRQSKRRPAYQPGKSQLAFITFTLGAAATGITRRVGLFDAKNGIFLEQTATALSFVRRSYATGEAVDVKVAQSAWSEDAFADLDVTKSQILVIDYEWLGVGLVRAGFVIDGVVRYGHYFRNANNLVGVYMSTPNLPVRWQLDNDGTGAASTLECICASIMSEGGQDVTGVTRSVDRAAAGLATASSTDIYPLLAIRLASTGLDATVRVLGVSVMCTTTADYRYALLLNPTVTGTALSFDAVTSSPVEVQPDTSNATTVSGGTLLASGYGSSSNQITPLSGASTDYALGSKVDGTSDVVVLAVQNLSAAVETYFGSLSWLEQI